MIGQYLFYQIEARCREAKPARGSDLFSGISFLLMGDINQLAPVNDIPLFSPTPAPTKRCDRQFQAQGRDSFLQFKDALFLEQVVRQKNDQEFASHLQHLRDGTFSPEEWNAWKSRSLVSLSEDEQDDFYQNATLLCALKRDNVEFNKKHLLDLEQPIVHVKARHNPATAELSYMPSSKAGGLNPDLWLCKNARVVLTANTWVSKGLANSAKGVVRGVIFFEGETPSNTIPILLVEFEGYTGPSITDKHPRCVPITPIGREWWHKGKMVTREMLPILLGWSITIHKSQGITVQKAIINLGKNEFSSGLTYTGMSRPTALD